MTLCPRNRKRRFSKVETKFLNSSKVCCGGVNLDGFAASVLGKRADPVVPISVVQFIESRFEFHSSLTSARLGHIVVGGKTVRTFSHLSIIRLWGCIERIGDIVI